MISHPKVFHASPAEVRVLFSGVFCLSNFRAAKFLFLRSSWVRPEFVFCRGRNFCGFDSVIELCGSLFFLYLLLFFVRSSFSVIAAVFCP